MKFDRIRLLNVCKIVGLLILLQNQVHATNGYFSHGFGTKSKSMAGAGVALSLDSLSAVTNPASAAFQDTQFDLGAALFLPNRGFTANNDAPPPPNPSIPAGRFRSDNDVFVLPHLGINWRLDEDSSAAFTLVANGGLNTDHDEPVFQNFAPPPPSPFAPAGATITDFAQILAGFTYARQFGERHSIGITPIAALQRIRIEGLEPFTALSVEPGSVTGKGYDYSYGGGVRVGWQGRFFDERLMFGASYQSRLWMTRFNKYDGLLAEHGDFDIPPTYTIGAAVQVLPTVLFTVDVQRILYGDIDSLSNDNDFPVSPGSLGGSDGLGFGWDDITIVKVGVAWQATPGFTLRGGYSKSEQVIPNNQALFNILAPATIEEHWTLGFSKSVNRNNEINFSFLYAPEERVSGSNPNTGSQTGFLELEQYEFELSWAHSF